ncbi:hypothetical protein EJ06DRAFT_526341 [Trichodelitschia bisporula]|uniref:Uncharacterized protein n=1 Tax=Trichodelitschia bisporula TaxID=703511 RepID=A0A6G1I7I1_9PEZI|nr:hypothetical protein EJ06DRAFT_526341 [Trichodelitschia bisporula]
MIKNHFQKYVNEGKYPELIEAVTQADRRRQLGEDPGPPPTPSQVIKRRNESATSSIQRALAPTPDADAAVDQVIGAQPPQMHGSPSQYPASGRFSVPGQTSRHMQPAGVSPPQHPVHMPPAPAQNPLTPQGHIPRHHQPNGPKLGYFREDRPHHGPSQPKEDVRAQKPPMERIKSEYDSQRQVLDRLPDREVQASKPQMGPDGGPPPLFQGPKETEKAFPPQDRPMFSGHMARQPAREHPEARAEAPPPQQPVHMQQQQQLMHQQVQPPIQPQQPAAQMHPPSAAPPEPQRQQKPPPTGPRHQVRPEPRMERLEQRVEPRMDRMEPRMEQRMEPRMEPRMDRMEQRMEPQEERRELRPEPVHDVRQEMRPERQGPPYGMPFGAPPPSAPIGQRGPTSQMVDMARHGSPQSHVSAFGPPSRIPRHASPVPPTPVQQPAPPQPPPPTKRVNIMSMLNPAEPEEDRPRKRDPEPQPPHGHSTPASMHRKVPGSADLTPTSREFSEIKRPDSRASYPRQAYHSHTPTSSLSTPINEQPPQPQGPQGPREQLAPRDIWQSRAIGPSMQQAQMASHIPPHMGSPHHAPHPGPETRPPMHYRGLSGLDHPAQRAVPSPPPAPYQTHSRVPSYGQQQHPSGPQHAAQHSASYPGPQPHATPHAQPQAPARSTQTPPVRPMDLRPNPYGSIDPPSSSVSLPGRHYAATSHPGAPHARNEFAHTQNAYPLAGHAERKREGQMDRFREREEERRVDRGRGVQEFDPRRVDMERGLAMHEREDARYRAPAGAPTGPREQVRPPPVYAPPPPPQLQQEHVLGSPPGQPHGYEQARRQAETWYPEHARMIDERRQQAPSGQGTAGYDVQHMEDLRMRQMQQQQQQQQQQSQWIRRER